MRVYPRSRYVAGAVKKECPRCGFDWLSTEMIVEERTGFLVCKQCYDPPQPRIDLKTKANIGGGVAAPITATAPGATVYNEEG